MDNLSTVHNFDLSQFKKAQESMIAKSKAAYSALDSRYYGRKNKKYTRKEIEDIMTNGSEITKRELSRNYFYSDGFYRRIIIYYATLLKFSGLLIPNLAPQLNGVYDNKAMNRYYNALDFIEQNNLPTLFTNFTTRALVDGAYYGAILSADKNNLVVVDLPADYCRSRFKDLNGNDIVEFDLRYFNKLSDDETRNGVLASYPEVITKAYRKLSRGKRSSNWVMLPSDVGICFTPFDEVAPLFLSTVLASLDFDDTVATEKERDKEEIKKIIIQQIPHNNENQLLFEPEEAVEIHAGTVEMMKNNENVSVLTTYADVEVASSKTSTDNVANSIEKMTNNIYNEAGVSGQLFGANSSMSIELSIENDAAMIMSLFGNRYASFITGIVNKLFGKGNMSFKYVILPITYYNSEKYTDSAFKLASSGYSYLLPAIGSGLSQRDIINIKDLENNVLDLTNRLKPLQSGFTQAGDSDAPTDEGGRPTMEDKDKNPSTIRKEESLDGQGGNK